MTIVVRRRRALRATLVTLLLLPACATSATRQRVGALDRSWAEAEHQAAPDAAADAPDPGTLRALLAPGTDPGLDRTALVAEVLRRNPTIAAARQAWRAALARIPQEAALEDPMLGYGVAPRSFGSSAVDAAHKVEVSQALPFPGKLALRGAVALGEAEAAAHDHAAVRLRLALVTSLLYDDHWLVTRSLAITEEHLALVRELLDVATAAYEAGMGSQQDPLRAELEEIDLLHRRVVLAASARVVAAQLAQLLHVDDPDAIPPPPASLPALHAPPDEAADAVARALGERPELAAADARIEAREAAIDLARREFLPDFRLIGMYDGLWEVPELKPFVGLEVNVPLQIGRRRAALDEAEARAAEAARDRARLRDEIGLEVRTALARLAEARHLLVLVRDRGLPAARDRLAAARAGFEAGSVAFGDMIDSERAVRDAELAVAEARADVSRRSAELEAALGRLPALGAQASPTARGRTP